MSPKKRTGKPAAKEKTPPEGRKPLLCIECPHARFPTPKEQCYKFGGLICTKHDINVGKYDVCCEVKNQKEG